MYFSGGMQHLRNGYVFQTTGISIISKFSFLEDERYLSGQLYYGIHMASQTWGNRSQIQSRKQMGLTRRDGIGLGFSQGGCGWDVIVTALMNPW